MMGHIQFPSSFDGSSFSISPSSSSFVIDSCSSGIYMSSFVTVDSICLFVKFQEILYFTYIHPISCPVNLDFGVLGLTIRLTYGSLLPFVYLLVSILFLSPSMPLSKFGWAFPYLFSVVTICQFRL